MQIPKLKNIIYMCQVKRVPSFAKLSCVREDKESLVLISDGKLDCVIGCLNRCNFGAVMIVGPGSYMYLDKEKIDKILKEYIIGGNPIKEYLISEEFLA